MSKYVKILCVVLILLASAGCSLQSNTGQVGDLTFDHGSAIGSNTIDEFQTQSPALMELDVKASTKKAAEQEGKKPLKDMTVCVDPGHGKLTKKLKKTEPIAPGATIMKAATAGGTTGVATKITEESLNLEVALKLRDALIEKGAKVIMVRETHVCNMTNVERTEFWNKSGADLTVRIHANGSTNKKVSGVLMMVPGNKYIKDKKLLEKSAKAGEFIMEAVLKNTKAKSMGTVKSNDLTGFNWSKIPVMLLEMGFMTNPEEDKLLNTASYQEKIVNGIVEGVEKYYNYTKTNIK